MGSIIEDIGEFFSSDFGSILAAIAGILGSVLIATPLAWLGYALIAGSVVAGLSAGYYVKRQAEKALEKLKSGSGGHLVNTRSSQEVLPVVYGTCRVGGNIIYLKTEGENNKYLYLVMTVSEGPIEIGDDVAVFLNEQPIVDYVYTKKAGNVWELRLLTLASSATNIQVKVRYEEKYEDCDESDCYDYWIDREQTILLSAGGSFSDNILSATWNADTVFVSVLDPQNYRLSSVHISAFSTDYGTTWTRNSYAPKFDFFLDRGDGIGEGDVGVRDYIVNTLGFKRPKNVALLFAKLTYDNKLYQGIPNITVLIKGRQVFDPRSNRRVFSNNPALVLLDYLTSRQYGFGIDMTRIDVDSFIDTANYCDDKGFVYDGVITDGRGIDIIEHILRHFNGYLVYRGGKFVLRVKDLRQENPVAVITEDDILEGTFQISLPDISQIPNAVKVNYINPEQNYKVDSLVVEDLTVSSVEERREIELDLFGANTPQAKYLAMYALERARLNVTVSFVASPEFFNLEVGDVFYLNYESYGISDQLFRIESIAPTPEGFCQITAIIEDKRLYNQSVDLDIYDIDLTDVPSPVEEPPDVQNVTITLVQERGQNGDIIPFLVIDFNTIPFCEMYEVWQSVDGGQTWTLVASGTPPLKVPALLDLEYRFRILPVSIFGVKRSLYSATEYVVNNKRSIFVARKNIIQHMEANIARNGVAPIMNLYASLKPSSSFKLTNRVGYTGLVAAVTSQFSLHRHGRGEQLELYSPYSREGIYVTSSKIFITTSNAQGYGSLYDVSEGAPIVVGTNVTVSLGEHKTGIAYADHSAVTSQLIIKNAETGATIKQIDISSMPNNGSNYDLHIWFAFWDTIFVAFIKNAYDGSYYQVVNSTVSSVSNTPIANIYSEGLWYYLAKMPTQYNALYINTNGELRQYNFSTGNDTVLATLPQPEMMTWSLTFTDLIMFGTKDQNGRYHVYYYDLTSGTLNQIA